MCRPKIGITLRGWPTTRGMGAPASKMAGRGKGIGSENVNEMSKFGDASYSEREMTPRVVSIFEGD